MSIKRSRLLLALWLSVGIAISAVPVFGSTITSLQPTSVAAGAASFTLTVNGAGFAPTDVVNWNGTALPTTFVSASQLQATVSSGLLLSGGTVSINVSPFPNALLITQSGTWGPGAPTTPFSAPNQTWSYSFSLTGTPSPSSGDPSFGFYVYPYSFQYSLNGSPVAGVSPAYVRFFSTAQAGGLAMFFFLEGYEGNFFVQAQSTRQQLYSGPELAPTILPGNYSQPTWNTAAYVYQNPPPSSFGPTPDTAGSLVITKVGSPSSFLTFTITAPPGGGGGVAAPVITTIAGTDWHFPAQTLPALSAPLGQMTAIAVDPAGNVYSTDSTNNIVERISTDGSLTVIAGNGIAGFSGDGGPATSASLNKGAGIPGQAFGAGGLLGVAVDSAGNLYIADTLNSRIRKVSGGIVTTVAGNGTAGFSGDGGPATSASLNSPGGIAVDSLGNLYIADTGNFRLRKVVGGIITTIAGNGTIASTGGGGLAVNASVVPQAIAVDSAGNVYLTDYIGLIRKISQGIITTVAGGGTPGSLGDNGPATSASLSGPLGIAVDLSGNLYIADTGDYRVRRVSNGIITTVAGIGSPSFSGDGGPGTSASLNTPLGVGVDSLGRIYIADVAGYQGRVRVISGGIINTIAGSGGVFASGDGGSAASASLFNPRTVAVDSLGDLYIADYDNSRVRKVARGIMSTVAGNGSYYGSPGDGGLATAATVTPTGVTVGSNQDLYIADQSYSRIAMVSGGIITTVAGNGPFGIPENVAADASGNIYIADPFNNRIRMLASGIVTTVAGNGTSGFSGDGGPATSAALNDPMGVAVDSFGNLYIAERGNNRIRKVSGGVITTVAGNGTAGYSGDGGPATSASLSNPWNVAVDSLGDLYIADTGNERVRMVSGSGLITTVAGNGSAGFSGDGGPAANASLGSPTGVAVDSSGNLYIADYQNSRIRVVLGSAPTFVGPPQSSTLELAGSSGGKPVLAALAVAASASAAGSIQVPGLAYVVQIVAGGDWLSVSPQSGFSPGLLTVKADPLNLAAGTHVGTLQIYVTNANPSMRTIAVSFTVTPGIPAAISIDQKHLSFTYATTSVARSQTIVLSNSGGGSLSFTTSISLNSGQSANWLSVAPASGTATPDNPVSMAVRANPSGLPLGTYTGSVTIQGGSAGSVKLPVTMTITTNPHVLLLSQTGLTFTAIQNGGAIPPQTFGVLNLGSGTLGWSVQTSTLAGGNWLNATPANGSSDAASPSGAPLVTVSVNPAGLQPDIYYGLVKVISNGAANTPQEVVVALRVLPAGIDLAPIVLPSSLIFTSPTGVSSPSSQNLLVYDPTGTHKSFRSAKATVNGGSWLVTLRGDATIAADQPASIVVQPIVNNLAAGVYTGTLTLEFSDGRVTAVPITFVVTGASGSSPPTGDSLPFYGLASTQTCTPSKLLPALTTLSAGFDVPANFPQQLIAQIVDDCGTPLTQGKVSVEFTTGQPIQYMDSLSNGRWDLTWQTAAQAVGVTLTVRAEHPTLPISGSIQITGGLGETKPPPLVNDNGVVSAASGLPTPVAPGGIITIYGSALSAGTGAAPVLPLPTLFNNTTVTLGDFALPLFYTSDGLLNALVPYGISTNTNMSLLVQRENSYADVVRLNVAAAQPEVFQYGMQQGIAVDLMGNLIGPSNPAHAAEALVVYCAGLGAVTPPVADGAAAGPSSTTTNQVIVTIDGKTANVASAGLTQGLPGLYQINLTVPQGVTPGDRVPVVVTAGGQTSSVVFFSVR